PLYHCAALESLSCLDHVQPNPCSSRRELAAESSQSTVRFRLPATTDAAVLRVSRSLRSVRCLPMQHRSRRRSSKLRRPPPMTALSVLFFVCSYKELTRVLIKME